MSAITSKTETLRIEVPAAEFLAAHGVDPALWLHPSGHTGKPCFDNGSESVVITVTREISQ